MNWQRKHEQLLDELNALAGRRVLQFARDTAHLTGKNLVRANELNDLNSLAVQMYYKPSLQSSI